MKIVKVTIVVYEMLQELSHKRKVTPDSLAAIMI